MVESDWHEINIDKEVFRVRFTGSDIELEDYDLESQAIALNLADEVSVVFHFWEVFQSLVQASPSLETFNSLLAVCACKKGRYISTTEYSTYSINAYSHPLALALMSKEASLTESILNHPNVHPRTLTFAYKFSADKEWLSGHWNYRGAQDHASAITSGLKGQIACNPKTSAKLIARLMKEDDEKVQRCALSHPSIGYDQLAKNLNAETVAYIARNPNIPSSLLLKLSGSEEAGIVEGVLDNPNLTTNSLLRLAKSQLAEYGFLSALGIISHPNADKRILKYYLKKCTGRHKARNIGIWVAARADLLPMKYWKYFDGARPIVRKEIAQEIGNLDLLEHFLSDPNKRVAAAAAKTIKKLARLGSGVPTRKIERGGRIGISQG